MKETLTTREQLAIDLQILSGGRYRKTELYTLAYTGDPTTLTSLPSVSTRWWNSLKVQTYYRERQAVFAAEKEAERQAIIADCEARHKAGEKVEIGQIDYSDPRNAIKKLNTLINTSKDPSETLDALKVMIAKSSELAPEKRQEGQVHRVYTPLRCHECPLYQEAKNNLNENKQQ